MNADPKLIVSWIFAYASKHQLYKVIQSIIFKFEISDFELTICDTKDFDYPMYAYLFYVIDNIYKKQVLENPQVWKTCVDILEMIFCRSKNIQLVLFTKLLNNLKFMVLLQLLKQEKFEEYQQLLDEYFPIKNTIHMEVIKEKLRIHSWVDQEMKNLVAALVNSRNFINSFVFHFNEFDQHYQYFICNQLKRFSIAVKEAMHNILTMEIDYEETIVEKILNGTFEDEELDYKNEINLVKKCFHQSDNEISKETCLLRLLAELKT